MGNNTKNVKWFRLQEIAQEYGITYSEIQERVQIPQPRLSEIWNNRVAPENPGIKWIRKIAIEFDLNIQELFEPTPKNARKTSFSKRAKGKPS